MTVLCRTRQAVRVLGRGTPGVDLEDRDFMGGRRPVRRDPSPEYSHAERPGSPEYSQAEGPGSPEYPAPTTPGSPEYPATTTPGGPKYTTSTEEAGMKAGTAAPAATRESTPSRMVSPAAGVEAIRPKLVEKLAESGTSVKGLRADWETEDESSPDSGLGGPESRAPRRSPAGSPTLRSGAAGSSMSGLSSSETASSVGGSTGV